MTSKSGATFTLPAEREQAFWDGVREAGAPHRLKDLADVLELIRHLSLPRETADSLDPSIRPKYEELWQAAQAPERE